MAPSYNLRQVFFPVKFYVYKYTLLTLCSCWKLSRKLHATFSAIARTILHKYIYISLCVLLQRYITSYLLLSLLQHCRRNYCLFSAFRLLAQSQKGSDGEGGMLHIKNYMSQFFLIHDITQCSLNMLLSLHYNNAYQNRNKYSKNYDENDKQLKIHQSN